MMIGGLILATVATTLAHPCRPDRASGRLPAPINPPSPRQQSRPSPGGFFNFHFEVEKPNWEMGKIMWEIIEIKKITG
jgi:hypothetical protein